MMLASGVMLFLILADAASTAFATDSSLGWTWLLGSGVGDQHSSLTPLDSSNYPGSRASAARWLDTDTSQLWMFGGEGYDENPTDEARTLGDLWRLDADTLQWTLLDSNAEEHHEEGKIQADPVYRPQPRSSASICGVTGSMLVLFGGKTNEGQTLYDTWIYDIPQAVWMPLHVHYINRTEKLVHPPARYAPATWCTEHYMYVYGGVGYRGATLEDMWRYSFRLFKWEKIKQYVKTDEVPLNAPSQPFPAARLDASAWVVGSDSLYMFAGVTDNGSYLQDIWQFSIKTAQWTFVSDNNITSRKRASSWYDSSNNVYIFAGCALINSSVTMLDDLHSFNLKDKVWNKIIADGKYSVTSASMPGLVNRPQQPSKRCDSISWSIKGQKFLFGGLGQDLRHKTSHLNDLYVLLDKPMSLTYPPKRNSSSKSGHPLGLSPSRIFLICFASFGGVVMVFGAVFFFKKMVDFPRHHPSRSYNVKYSPLNDEAMFDM